VSGAGDFDYETRGAGYGSRRRTDRRIEEQVHAALGDARSVINVGAGTGSYEPEDRYVVAVEPSASMRSQRTVSKVPAIDGRAESLPFDDATFDAAMAIVTVHQWSDCSAGLRELRRVSRGPVVVMTFDGGELDRFWLARYAPELIEAERRRYPTIGAIREVLGGRSTVLEVTIPLDCADGFTEAFYGRPEAFLESEVRRSQSAWGFVDRATEESSVRRLADALARGRWDAEFGHLRTQGEFVGSLRLVTAVP
jgi:Methyltransferase domain